MKPIKWAGRAICLAAAAVSFCARDARGTVVSWATDASGNWNVATNWSSNPALPGSADDVVISRPSAATVVTYNIPNVDNTLNGLTIDNTLRFLNGSLEMSTAVQVNGTLTFGGNSDFAAPALNIAPTGLVNVEAGRSVSIHKAVVNGDIALAQNSTLHLRDGAKNHGTIRGNGAAIVGFEFNNQPIDADVLGTLELSNSQINFSGTYVNTGREVVLDGATGNHWSMSGTATGGTFTGLNGGTFETSNITLNNVTLNANGSMGNSNRFVNRLTLLNDVTVQLTGQLGTNGTGSDSHEIAGNGRIQMMFGSSFNPGAAGTGTTSIAEGITIGGQGTFQCGPKRLVNRGTIIADTPFGMLSVTSNSGFLQNDGTILVDNGGSMGWGLSATSAAQNGVIIVKNGTFSVGQLSSQAQLGNIQCLSNGHIQVSSAVDNVGKSINLNATTGSWKFLFGSINGGQLTATGGSQFVFGQDDGGSMTSPYALTGGVKFTGPSSVSRHTLMTITGGLTLDGTMKIGGDFEPNNNLAAHVDFSGTQTLGGTGAIEFAVLPNDGIGGRAYLRATGGGTLTIASTMSVRTANGDGTVVGPIINNGTIAAASAGQLLDLQGAITNNGRVEARDGGTLRITGTVTTSNPVRATSGGRIEGTGTINGSVANIDGRVAPGVAGQGVLNVVGNYDQDSDAMLAISIFGGPAASRPFDRLNVTGTADLDGELFLTLGNTTALQLGDQFDIFDFGQLNGTFSRFTLPTIGPGKTWDLSLLYTSGVISVVAPEPTLVAPIAFAVIGLTRRRRAAVRVS